MEGSNGGRTPWSYREQTGTISSSYSTVSSSSGTVSTGYTSTASHMSWISMEAARHLEEVEEEEEEVEVDTDEFLQLQPVKKSHKETEKKHNEFAQEMSTVETAKEKKMEQIKSLVKEFFDESSIQGGNMSVLERWFVELGVGWVLHLPAADGAPEVKLEQTLDASRWMTALTEIVDAFCLMKSLFSCHGSVGKEDRDNKEIENPAFISDQFQFASFTRQAMLKMLCFIDVIDAPNHHVKCANSMSVVEPYRKLHILFRVRHTLSDALYNIRFSSRLPPSAQVGRTQSEIVSVLSVKNSKAGQAIWSAMEENWNRILESVQDADDSSGTRTPQGSSDIHEATKSLVKYVMFLQHDYFLVNIVLSEVARLGRHLPQIRYLPTLRSLIVEMMSCVHEKLANMSEKFPDQRLRFLFLINNLSFIGDQLKCTPYFPEDYNESLAGKVEAYVERYIQLSWAPVLSCLLDPSTPLCFGKTYSPLLKFESEFHKTYTTQKLWKVPDPKLRKTLREAISDKIVPGYAEYIEDNNVATPKFTPQNLEEMVQELFEG